MSRIHEALKRAQEERALTLQVNTAAPQESTRVETSVEELAPVAAAGIHVHTSASVIAPPSSDYLQFDDIKAHCSHPRWRPDPKENVFINSDQTPLGAEQFRTLRSRLYQLRGGQSLRTLLVTSSVPAEGKTYVANNLAQAFVRQPDCRVLLIDADLRCSRLHGPMGAPSAPGLTDYLRGNADEMAVIQQGQDGNLCFISGGTEMKDPSELLSNGRLKIFLERVKLAFDWVIVDSPPCLPVADANGLADLSDGVLLVVRAGSTPAEVAQRACQEMRSKNVVGIVLNAVDEKDSPSGYYGHYGYSRDQNASV
jgi:capsular exopolysaccharide synthesis family protein